VCRKQIKAFSFEKENNPQFQRKLLSFEKNKHTTDESTLNIESKYQDQAKSKENKGIYIKSISNLDNENQSVKNKRNPTLKDKYILYYFYPLQYHILKHFCKMSSKGYFCVKIKRTSL
jgi:hypothetical protein